MKKILGAFFAAMMVAQAASAQVVTVDGVGTSRDAAVRDAERNAVEMVAGTYIDSQTLAQDMSVQLDSIYAQSQGFVRGVSVLQESAADGAYRVRASVDVDTDPNAALMNRLQAVAQLNNPRIAVIVLEEEDKTHFSGVGNNGHDTVVESALDDQLLSMGFTHVVDANRVAQLQDSEALNNIYNGVTRLSAQESARPIDYLVLGKCSSDAYAVKVPDFKGGYNETQVKSAGTELTIKIIDYATGTIVGTYDVEGQGVDNSPKLAEHAARKDAARQAAEKLEQKFRHVAAQPFSGIQLRVIMKDASKQAAFEQAVRTLAGVQNVTFREMHGTSVVYDVDAILKPYELANLLRSQSGLPIFVEDVSSSELAVVVN